MIIQIDGTNTLNKGAELMLLAVLDQIEKHRPDAVVYYNSVSPMDESVKEKAKLTIEKRAALEYGRLPKAILKRLHLPYTFFTEKHPRKDIDLVLDASGFQFSDQWNYSKKRLDTLEAYYKSLKQNDTKIILLPQAFGPFETDAGKRSVAIANEYVDVIIAREKVSRDYVVEAGAASEKVWEYTDFTLLVDGVFPNGFKSLKDKVCIIPNKKMVTHTGADANKYWRFLEHLIVEVEKNEKEIFLLNHEGEGDLEICRAINSRFDNKYTIVTDLGAREIKGVIGASFFTVSSRFHGVASSLSQGIPCLATSWNHKYGMLFKDYDMEDKILEISNDPTSNSAKIVETIQNRDGLHQKLIDKKQILTEEIETMWQRIWAFV